MISRWQRYAAEAEKLNKQKDAAWAAWKAALTPDQISRERKVQAYRRSQGLKIPTASRYATRRTISAGAATKKSPFITFYKGLYDQPGAGERVCGPAWNTASASEKGKLAGQAWKGLSNAEKEVRRAFDTRPPGSWSWRLMILLRRRVIGEERKAKTTRGPLFSTTSPKTTGSALPLSTTL